MKVMDQLSKVGDMYTNNIKKFGTDSKSLGWNDTESQLLRFDKLMQCVKSNDRDIEILDLGCGFGELFDYCDSSLDSRLASYVGYDISENMIRICNNRVKDNRAKFINSSNFDSEVDYSIVSGSFNVCFDANRNNWSDYVKETIAKLYKASRKGIAFNLLTSYVDWEADGLFYADPKEFFDFCVKNISRHVVLIHDYPLYEWTIYVYR